MSQAPLIDPSFVFETVIVLEFNNNRIYRRRFFQKSIFRRIKREYLLVHHDKEYQYFQNAENCVNEIFPNLLDHRVEYLEFETINIADFNACIAGVILNSFCLIQDLSADSKNSWEINLYGSLLNKMHFCYIASYRVIMQSCRLQMLKNIK